MGKLKNSGFTLIELLAVIVILAIILAIAIPGITGIISNATKGSFKSDAKMVLKALDYQKLKDDTFDPTTVNETNINSLLGLSNENYQSLTVTLVNNKPKVVIVGKNKWANLIATGTYIDVKVVNSSDYDVTPPVITLLGSDPARVNLGSSYTDAGATATDNKDGDITSSIIVTGTVNTNSVGTYIITYNVSDSSGNVATSVTRTVNVVRTANPPVLAAGMTPIKWNGSTWVDTTESDATWYNYDTASKQWANARTADGSGSMWVWIPRYIYNIPTANWHTSTAGTIDVQFSVGTDDTIGGTVTLDTGTTANASNNKWTNEPAFTFGSTELTGIWVAKFEASGSPLNVDVKPGVPSLYNLNVGDEFSIARSMETNSRYGWGTSGSGIDTHMMKNTEWGAAAYLAQSTYGINSQITKNSNSSFYTGGGAGNAYVTNIGQSTTGNVYGIYDMSGGTWEFVAAYVNTTNYNLAAYGSNIKSADGKYKDVYAATSDSGAGNYTESINQKGDAVYETSNSYTASNSWYSNYSYMANTSSPWFLRGGSYSDVSGDGGFSFYCGTGNSNSAYGFRPVLIVGPGL